MYVVQAHKKSKLGLKNAKLNDHGRFGFESQNRTPKLIQEASIVYYLIGMTYTKVWV